MPRQRCVCIPNATCASSTGHYLICGAFLKLSDFLRFGVKYAEELYSQQPGKNAPGAWKCVYFVVIVTWLCSNWPDHVAALSTVRSRDSSSPSHRLTSPPSVEIFPAVSSNIYSMIGHMLTLCCEAPALVGNTVVWKPSPAATYSNYIIYKIFAEAGVPPGVIQFVPGVPEAVVGQAIAHPDFAALHFTGSTFVFKKLWKDIAQNVDIYKSYPRIVGETGGKNFHLIHPSAEIRNAVAQTVRGAFEYQGQKCSALSRLYVAASVWTGGFKEQLLGEVASLKVGPPTDFTNFVGAVMCVAAWMASCLSARADAYTHTQRPVRVRQDHWVHQEGKGCRWRSPRWWHRYVAKYMRC